jgi:phenylpyruvate tautomerase PptA (4-oxalocrotonate tautomerase family)
MRTHRRYLARNGSRHHRFRIVAAAALSRWLLHLWQLPTSSSSPADALGTGRDDSRFGRAGWVLGTVRQDRGTLTVGRQSCLLETRYHQPKGRPMPTYTCWATADTIGAGDRPKIVEALTEIHHEVAVAPRYFVQVVFNDLAPGSIYIAGQPADTGHVWIRADIRAGRTDEQKKTLLEEDNWFDALPNGLQQRLEPLR